MTISQYMQYLKILKDRYGDIDVKIETRYETMGEDGFEYDFEYSDVNRPIYAKNKKCIVIHKDYVSFD